MLAGAISACVESLGDYYAAARISGAPVPPPGVLARGLSPLRASVSLQMSAEAEALLKVAWKKYLRACIAVLNTRSGSSLYILAQRYIKDINPNIL